MSKSTLGLGMDHHSWQNIDLHKWVKKVRGAPTACVGCGKTKEEALLDWANISRKYKKDVKDYQPMCRSCHRKFDFVPRTHCGNGHEYTAENTWIRRPQKEGRNPSRVCRTCMKINKQRFLSRRRQTA